jgi:hypothetical protein
MAIRPVAVLTIPKHERTAHPALTGRIRPEWKGNGK